MSRMLSTSGGSWIGQARPSSLQATCPSQAREKQAAKQVPGHVCVAPKATAVRKEAPGVGPTREEIGPRPTPRPRKWASVWSACRRRGSNTTSNWPCPAPPPSRTVKSRSVTRGAYRGHGEVYDCAVPASPIVRGVNTARISVVSRSSGAGFLECTECGSLCGPHACPTRRRGGFWPTIPTCLTPLSCFTMDVRVGTFVGGTRVTKIPSRASCERDRNA